MPTEIERIPDDEYVFRRIPSVQYPTPTDLNSRPITASFLPRDEDTDGLSVELARLTTPENVADVPGKRYQVVQVCVSDLRSLGLDVISDPLPDNPAHALILGLDRQTYDADKPQLKALAETIIRKHCETVWISPDPAENPPS